MNFCDHLTLAQTDAYRPECIANVIFVTPLLWDGDSGCCLVPPSLWKRFCYMDGMMLTFEWFADLESQLGTMVLPPTLYPSWAWVNQKEQEKGILHGRKGRSQSNNVIKCKPQCQGWATSFWVIVYRNPQSLLEDSRKPQPNRHDPGRLCPSPFPLPCKNH